VVTPLGFEPGTNGREAIPEYVANVCSSAAGVRKLITPIQVNIAEQQENVAGSVTTGPDIRKP